MPAGYSQTPLIKKLGIKSGHKIVLLGAPDGYAEQLGAMPPGSTVRRTHRDGSVDPRTAIAVVGASE